MSTDPSDLNVLTPGHFLIGAPLNSLPEHDLEDVPVNRLQRWQLTQQLVQHFNKRWVTEYLHELQQRTKWTKEHPNLRINDVVLIKPDQVNISKWNLGRIVKVHPGSDDKVRAATIKTIKGEIQRPIHKLALLPFRSE
jgi:Family of unknown function (DUF5641)